MSAPTRLRHPSPGAVARGSALGLGLLVASAAVAPAALATDDATDPVAPDTTPHAPTVTPVALNPSPAGSPAVSGPINASFGTGKQFDLALTVDGDTPADLDLAGARFALTAAGGTTAATCVTRTDGTCTVNYAYAPSPGGGTGSSVSLTDGTYTVTQVSAVDGLTPVSGPVGTVTMDYGAWHFGGAFIAPNRVPVVIADVAQYSRTVTAAVVDAAGNPLSDVGFSLTGPAYPGAAEAYDSGTVTSDAGGLLTFDGWFWPEHWTLTPLRVPAGSELGDPLLVVVPATPGFHAPQTWAVGDAIEVRAPAPSPNGDEGSTGGDPSTPPTPPVVVPPSVVVPPAAAPSPSTTSRPRAVTPVAEDPTVPAPAPAPAAVPTATYDGRSSLPQEDRSPNTDPAPALLAAPPLQTASSNFSEVGLVGIGVLFVAAVAAGVVFLRRRMLRG